MKYRKLGGTGFEVSTVSLGTWAMGGRDYGRVDDRDSEKAIHRAMDLGVNLFDTAPIYGDGRAEEVLGTALGSRRKDVFVATKCGPVQVRVGMVRLDLSAEGLARQCEDSLRRLRTDYVDLMQVHWNDPAIPVEDTIDGLQGLVKAGKVRAFGVSNFEAREVARAADAGPLASLQSRYSLICRELEAEVLPLCAERNVGFLAYEPLARGLLTGKFREPRSFEPTDVRNRDDRFAGSGFALHVRAADALSDLAASLDMKPAQLAVAWVLARQGVTSAICGSKTAAQIAECARAGDMDIDEDVVSEAVEITREVAVTAPTD